MKVLLVAEIDAASDLPTVQTMLDNFREAVQPSQEYGITLSLATADDITSLTPASTPPVAPTAKLPTTEDLLDAIKEVETGGNSNAIGDGGKSQGAYQIGWAYTQDASQQIAKEHGKTPPQYSDIVHDDLWCREIIKAYWRRYLPSAYDTVVRQLGGADLALEMLARAHNGGGVNGPKIAATIPYWVKVKAVLQKRGFTL